MAIRGFWQAALAEPDRLALALPDGRTLSEIARILSGPAESKTAPPAVWWQYAIAEDVMVWVRAGAAPWRMKQVSLAIDEFSRGLQPPKKGGTE